jgi:uncharacterized SAM-binding protein YcdF (DUF218 family)
VFFLLSKTLGIMLLPVNFLVGVGVLGAILVATRWAGLGRRLLILSVAVLAIAGFSPLGKLLLYPLEKRFPPWDSSRGPPDGIVVLGGAIDPDLSVAIGRVVFTHAADRIVATAALARRYPNARIVLSGGNSNLISDDSAKETDYMLSVFESLGIARERLTMERRSRNTQENAEFSKAVAKPKDGERWLLVTSAYHMPRSMGVFRKSGFVVEACPVDWRLGGTANNILMFSPIAIEGLERTDIAVREWMGLAAYWATGKINALLPGPGAEPPVATTPRSG